MRKLLATVAFAFVAVPLFGALQYDFVQKHTSDDDRTPTRDLSGRATIDGARTRIDFLTGNLYPPGTYMITTDGSRSMFFVDPVNKWYTEVNTSGIVSALGAIDIVISNRKSEATPKKDTATIAGIPTKHQHLEISFDIAVKMKGLPLRQHANIEIDSWTTDKYPDEQANVVAETMRTGNAQIDEILSEEGAKIHGFPLRRTVTIRMTSDMAVKSQLHVPRSKTITRETLVTSIREASPDAMIFVVPLSYKRADQPDAPPSDTKTLTFEPGSK